MALAEVPWRHWGRRRARRQLRRQMRGYHRLKASGRVAMLGLIRDEITNTPLRSSDGKCVRFFFGEAFPSAEIAIRQYLLLRVIGANSLYTSLLRSIGDPSRPVTHPLPAEWRAVLERHGFRVARRRAAWRWHWYVLLLFGYGGLGILKTVIRSLRAGPPAQPAGRYVFFAALSPANLPQPEPDGRHFDLLSWYQEWPGRRQPIDTLCHTATQRGALQAGTVAVRQVESAVPPLRERRAVAAFIGWAAAACALAAVDLLRGRWWHALLLHEAAAGARTRLQVPERLAREYLFHNSDSLYRPLWTYEAAAKGSQVTFYFYSANNETLKTAAGYPIQTGSWQVMRWPRYLVWDEPQADFVRRAVGASAATVVVGPIWFTSSATPCPVLPGDSVAVFDVQPVRASFFSGLGVSTRVYTPDNANQVLIDVHEAVRARGATMALKRKRSIGPLLHRRYGSLVEKLSVSPNFVAVPPDVNAYRVIEQASAVVSMPFTSTALLAAWLGKPSIYYDPLGLIQVDDRAAHGIPILRGFAELDVWLSSHLGRGHHDEPASVPHRHDTGRAQNERI